MRPVKEEQRTKHGRYTQMRYFTDVSERARNISLPDHQKKEALAEVSGEECEVKFDPAKLRTRDPEFVSTHSIIFRRRRQPCALFIQTANRSYG
jgi:hypothetical protein